MAMMQGAHLTDKFGLLLVNLTDQDKAVAKIMFEAWCNFAEHG